jgi:ligand-binding sensor domain-containing protein
MEESLDDLQPARWHRRRCIHSIVQSSGGAIWVATEYGLSRFDGRRWEDADFSTGSES